MSIKWGRLLCECVLWLSAELVLGYVEFDNLADYCEYLKERDLVLLCHHTQAV
jgi:hypothetical protein